MKNIVINLVNNAWFIPLVILGLRKIAAKKCQLN